MGCFGVYYLGFDGMRQWDGPGEECELHIVSSGPQRHILVLVTGAGEAIGGVPEMFCIYGYEIIDCFVEYCEAVSANSKGEWLPFQLGHHFLTQ